MLEGGGKLSWYEDKERSVRMGGLMLLGEVCAVPPGGAKAVHRSGKAEAVVTPLSPVLSSFIDDYHKYPFTISHEAGV